MVLSLVTGKDSRAFSMVTVWTANVLVSPLTRNSSSASRPQAEHELSSTPDRPDECRHLLPGLVYSCRDGWAGVAAGTQRGRRVEFFPTRFCDAI